MVSFYVQFLSDRSLCATHVTPESAQHKVQCMLCNHTSVNVHANHLCWSAFYASFKLHSSRFKLERGCSRWTRHVTTRHVTTRHAHQNSFVFPSPVAPCYYTDYSPFPHLRKFDRTHLSHDQRRRRPRPSRRGVEGLQRKIRRRYVHSIVLVHTGSPAKSKRTKVVTRNMNMQ